MRRQRYFLKLLDLDWIEVTKAEFIQAERSAGFKNRNGDVDENATSGFGNGTISGYVEYVSESEIGQSGDLTVDLRR
jgi:hypothetical protein